MKRSIAIVISAIVLAAALLAGLGYYLLKPSSSGTDPESIILNQADLPLGWTFDRNASYVHTEVKDLSDPGAEWEAKHVFFNMSAPYGRHLIVYVVSFQNEEWAQVKFGHFNGSENDDNEEIGEMSSVYYIDNGLIVPGTSETYVSAVLTTVTFVEERYFVMVQFVTDFTPADEPFHIYTTWMNDIVLEQENHIEGKE
jgi:hypothetical protein